MNKPAWRIEDQKGFSTIAGVVIGILVLSAAVAGGFLIFKQSGEKDYSTKYYEYRFLNKDGTWGQGPSDFNSSLIRKNKQTGEEEVIFETVNDLKKLFTDQGIQISETRVLAIYDQPENSQEIILRTLLLGTEGVGRQLYSFNVRDFEVKELASTASAQIGDDIKIENHFGGVQVDLDDIGQRWMLIRGTPNFEGELSQSTLYLIDAKNKDSKTIENVSGALLLDTKTALISKYFSVEPNGLSIGDPGYNEARQKLVSEVAKKLGLADKEVGPRIYLVGGKPSAAVNALFEVNLETGAQKSLKLFGGQGGIFRTQDKQIYISNSNVTSAYKVGTRPDRGGLFGSAPYIKYDLVSKSLAVTGLPDGFQAGKVVRPIDYLVNEGNKLDGVGGASVVTRDNTPYVTFR